MVIQCEKCQTVFNLDKSLIKKTGAKVRCSLCGHAFRVFPEGIADKTDAKSPDATPKMRLFPDTEISPENLKETSESHAKRTENILSELQSNIESIYEEVFKDSNVQDDVGDGSESFDEVKSGLNEIIGKAEHSASYLSRSVSPFEVLNKPGTFPKKEQKEKSEKFEQEKTAGKKSSRGKLVLFIIIVVLMIGVFLAWSTGLVPSSIISLLQGHGNTEPEDSGDKLLKFELVKGVFINTSKHGPLFVIKGRVTNNYLKARSHILVRGTILDSNGGVVMARNAYAGKTFSEEALKDLTLEEIRNISKDPNGMQKRNVAVLSGASIPFMIVFVGVPEKLSEFRVETVSSSAENK